MHNVFVYGTLKRGQPNHDAIATFAEFVGVFQTREPFPLVVGGQWFSPYLIDEPGEGYLVSGEVFSVNSEGLEQMDVLEGTHVPGGYRRARIDVECPQRRLVAWTYFKDRAAIDGIASDPMDQYRLDTRYVIPSNRPKVF